MLEESIRKLALTPEKIILVGMCGAVFFSPISISLSTFFAYVAFAVALFSGRVFSMRRLWLKSVWLLPVIALVGLTWLGVLYSRDVQLGLKFAVKTHYWLLAFAAVPLVVHRQYTRMVVKAFILGISLTSVVYLLQLAGVVPYLEDNRPGFIISITYSLFLVFGMLLLTFLGRKRKGMKDKLLFLITFALLFFSLIFCRGRAGYLAFAVLLPLMLYSLFGIKRVVKIFIACVVLVGMMFLSPVVRDRVAKGIDDIENYKLGDADTSVGRRFNMWKGASRIFLEKPILGGGTGSYSKLMEKYEFPFLKGHNYVQPHNSYLYMLSSYGVTGLAVFMWFFASLLVAGWRGRETVEGFALLSYVLIMVVGSLTDTQIIQGQSALLLAVFTGLGGSSVRAGTEQLDMPKDIAAGT